MFFEAQSIEGCGALPAVATTAPQGLSTQAIAKVCHEINRAYCTALGDLSQPAWEDAPSWQRESAINGVLFHVANPLAGPDHSHNAWLAEKRNSGWKYGRVKDAELKEHPCFVPYEQLPREQQAKDYLFRAVVHQLAALANEQLSRDLTDAARDDVHGG